MIIWKIISIPNTCVCINKCMTYLIFKAHSILMCRWAFDWLNNSNMSILFWISFSFKITNYKLNVIKLFLELATFLDYKWLSIWYFFACVVLYMKLCTSSILSIRRNFNCFCAPNLWNVVNKLKLFNFMWKFEFSYCLHEDSKLFYKICDL